MLIVLDNYDSFTYNLVQYLGEQDAEIRVFRDDALSVEELHALEPSHIVILPGHSNPTDVRRAVPFRIRVHAARETDSEKCLEATSFKSQVTTNIAAIPVD